MRTVLLVGILLSLTFIFQSCEKDDIGEKAHTITGHWIGTYNIQHAVGGEEGGSFYYSFFIRNDDTIQVQGVGHDGNTYYGIGSWSLADSNFSATITTTNLSQAGAVQNVTAIFDKRNGVLKEGRVESVGFNFVASFELWRAN
jgi:hypothetical protein